MHEVVYRIATHKRLEQQTLTGKNEKYLTVAERADFLERSQVFMHDVGAIYTPQEQKGIYEALLLMTQVQLRQEPRPDGPYIFHPLEVAHNLVNNMQQKDASVVMAGLLHDIVEDQPEILTTLSVLDGGRRIQDLSTQEQALGYIAKHFGTDVADTVKAVTNPDFNEEVRQEFPLLEKSSAEFKMQKVRRYHIHFDHILQNPKAFLVKLADFETNALTTMQADVDESQRAKYISKYGPMIPSVMRKLDADPLLNIKDEVVNALIVKFAKTYRDMGHPAAFAA